MVLENREAISNKVKFDSANEFIEYYASVIPDQIAVIDGNESISYGVLNQKANKLAHYLLSKGVTPETIVAIALPRSIDVLITIVAILKAGGAFVPLDYNHPHERLFNLLEDNKAPFLILLSDFAAQFADFKGQTIFFDQMEAILQQYSTQNLSRKVETQQLAYVIYTSGSTGKPKGVLIEHQSLINFTLWFQAFGRVSLGEKIDFSSNYIFDLSLTTSIVALMLGLQVVICSDETKRDVREYAKFLEKNKINITKMTPSFFKVLWQQIFDKDISFEYLKTIVLGGENLRTVDCINWLKKYPEHTIFNEYGPTEATVAVLKYQITLQNVHYLGENVPLGTVDPGFNIACVILDDKGQEVSVNTIGELHIGGLQVARGYLNAPELTKKKFINHPMGRLYRTGDLCRYLKDGNIEYLGRIDDQIKLRGYRIDLHEIELILSKHPSIKDVAVIARETNQAEKQIIAYYLTNEASEPPNAISLRQFLQQTLPDYMIPVAFVAVDYFPLNANGKLEKQALPEPSFDVAHNTKEALTEIEQKIADIWIEVLNLNQVKLADNFFELGGHSLAAARVINRIEKYLGKIISFKDFYQSPTIKAQAAAIEQAKQADNKYLIVATSNENMIALSDFQFLFWISYIFEPKVKKLNVFARRRMYGKLDVQLLKQAFELLFKKHQIIYSRIGAFFPTQKLQKELVFDIPIENISDLARDAQEARLSASLNEIINHYCWPKNQPLIMAKVFYLNDDVTELQIWMPHIVSDDASEEILFSDLSNFYNLLRDGLPPPDECNTPQFASYVLTDKEYANRIDTDIKFWEKYLSDVSLFNFPLNIIDFNCKQYSTYLDLPDNCIKNIQLISAKHQISYVDVLCAAIVLGLKKYFHENGKNKYLLLNIIRSTREHTIFEKMIGCFLRLDPVKVNMNENLSLVETAKQIRRTQLEIAEYQHCTSMVKLACMAKKQWKNKYILNSAIKLLTNLYAKLFPQLKLNPKILSMYPRLTTLRKRQKFLINLNLFNNFLSTRDLHAEQLFGYQKINLNIHQHDLSTIDNVLDICFLRDDAHHKNYLAISANLKPAFRLALGNTIIDLMLNK